MNQNEKENKNEKEFELEKLRKDIVKYIPKNKQEEVDRKLILNYMDTFDDTLIRKNMMCHFTASSWIVNKERTKVLMIYHNIYDSWAWTGGHADGDANLLNVALKEAKEETGISNLKVISEEIFGLQILTVDSHIKRGEYIPSHLHLDCCFLFEADENETLSIKADENSGVKWILIDEVLNYSTEEKMKKIYVKLNENLKK